MTKRKKTPLYVTMTMAEAEDYARRESGADLTFSALRRANVSRCEEVFHPLDDWSALEWAGATAGELGEAANKTKKLRRGEKVSLDDVGDEMADTIMYIDLWAARLRIDLGAAVKRKFDAVSKKKRSAFRLGKGS